MKENKNGITLIALIITIIVMLILVGVTINLSAKGELFSKSKTAKVDTAYEAEEENLLLYVFGEDYDAVTGKLNLESLKEKLEANKNEWKLVIYDEKNQQLRVTGVQSNKVHKINADGTFEKSKSDSENPGQGSGDLEQDVNVTPVTLKSNTNLGKITLNKKVSKINNISAYTFKDKFRAYNENKDFLELNIIELNDNEYIILFSTVEKLGSDKEDGKITNFYVYAFGPLNTSLEGWKLDVSKEGWYKADLTTGTFEDEVATDFPIFEGYTTTDWETDERIPTVKNVPNEVASDVEDYMNKLFANILIVAE